MSLDFGSVPDWIAALGGLASAGLAGAALLTAGKANELARSAHQDAVQATQEEAERQNEAEKRARERENRRMAGTLQAWWVKEGTGQRPPWGIIVSNEGAGSAVFHDVKITTTNTGDQVVWEAGAVPPGRYFVESKFLEDKEGNRVTSSQTGQWIKAFALARPSQEPSQYSSIMHGETHSVTRIDYKDPMGTQWIWTPYNGLQRGD